MSFAQKHLKEAVEIISLLDYSQIDKMAIMLSDIRAKKGRLFFLGVGGSAANCSHAVNDFRKICGFECYSPTDNVAELTARINDDGWASSFSSWLQVSNLNSSDALMIFSVGGGNLEKNISPNIVKALEYAVTAGSSIFGIVGRDGGYTSQVADCSCIIPIVNSDSITPHTEAFQAVIWHLLVTHPVLSLNQTKWENEDELSIQN